MKFPRGVSHESDKQTSALERLDEARAEEQRLTTERDAAEPGPREVHAETELRAAGEQVAAREAWAKWSSRDE